MLYAVLGITAIVIGITKCTKTKHVIIVYPGTGDIRDRARIINKEL